MRTRSQHGGRHELGQNFLIHTPTIDRMIALVRATRGPILEIGAGDGALTRKLAALGRPFEAIDIDEHQVAALAKRLPSVRVIEADAMQHPLDAPTIVGNLPYHLTTPILRRLLRQQRWRHAIVLTQWEVARKRAGVGGGTMMTAQAAPWFEFRLQGRVPARGFRPMPSVDGGVLAISRRGSPLVAIRQRRDYELFVRTIFTARGRGLAAMLQSATGGRSHNALAMIRSIDASEFSLPRDLVPEQWAALWHAVAENSLSRCRR